MREGEGEKLFPSFSFIAATLDAIPVERRRALLELYRSPRLYYVREPECVPVCQSNATV